MTGGVIGSIFAISAAIFTAKGTQTFSSGLNAGVVFVIVLIGWSLTGGIASGLSEGLTHRSAANWIGIVAAVPAMIANSIVILRPSRLWDINTLVVFVMCDVAFGLIGAEVMWNEYHKKSDDSAA